MCTYCMMGDWVFRYNPPWAIPDTQPMVPMPINPFIPVVPWTIDSLREYEDLMRRVKAMEDRLGCPCEPNKADYLTMFRKRIEELEKKIESGDAT